MNVRKRSRKGWMRESPPGPRGEPQNTVRHMVYSQRLHGKSFDDSIEIACNLVRQQCSNFTPKILPPPPKNQDASQMMIADEVVGTVPLVCHFYPNRACATFSHSGRLFT